MVTINPADCDRTTVYTGEFRNYSDTAWVQFQSGRRRAPDAPDYPWLVDSGTGSFWTRDTHVRNLVPLVPGPTPAVSYADIEKAVADWVDDAPEVVNEVWSLVSGSDPAVFVVRESNIAAVKVVKGVDGREWIAGNYSWLAGVEAHELRRGIPDTLGLIAAKEAIARAIEAESADPVEDKARELHEVAQGDGPFIVWEALMDPERNRYRRMAAHVLRQEAGDE